MEYEFFAILLLLVGFALIVAEVFLPSGGMILVLCAMSFIASFWCAAQAWYGTHPVTFGLYITSLVVLIPTVVMGAFQLFPRTSFGRNLMAAPTLEEVTPYAQEREHLSQLVGRIGRAITPLTPGGLVMLDYERLHAFTEGVLIDRDTPVEIIDVRGTRVVVREAPAPGEQFDRQEGRGDASLRAEADESMNEDDSSEPPLDFALPRS
jgi:membrane-bound serine protease (ClpP class)